MNNALADMETALSDMETALADMVGTTVRVECNMVHRIDPSVTWRRKPPRASLLGVLHGAGRQLDPYSLHAGDNACCLFFLDSVECVECAPGEIPRIVIS